MSITLGTIIAALFLTFVAGIINGSFATPTKYMTGWKEENIWFFFSFWGMLLFPWLTLFLLSPNQIGFISHIPNHTLFIAVAGGLLFGIGQLCFSMALGLIGIGLSFLINISMGTAGAALVPLLGSNKEMFSVYGILQFTGILIFVIAVTIGVRAGTDRDKNTVTDKKGDNKSSAGKTLLGIIFAVAAGVGSACQGLSYTYANPVISKASLNIGMDPLSASISTWIIVFSVAWFPYCIYFLILSIKNKSLPLIFKSYCTKEYLFLFSIMALGYWGSVVFFSRASSLIGGDLAPTIAWPLFMIFIILTSNFWGWASGEWNNAGTKAIAKIWTSIGLFVFAIIVFSCSAVFHP
jgi:L-rhamnose-H+ transport protein